MSGLLARGILLSFPFRIGQGSGIQSHPTLLSISRLIVKNLPEKVLGAVAKWLRQRIANPPPWVRLPPAPLMPQGFTSSPCGLFMGCTKICTRGHHRDGLASAPGAEYLRLLVR